MFFDLEAVPAIVHSIVSVWSVRTQLVSCFILSGVPQAGANEPVSRGSLGHVEWGLLSCSATPCLTCGTVLAVVPFTCLQHVSYTWAHGMAESVRDCSFLLCRLLVTSLFDRSGG